MPEDTSQQIKSQHLEEITLAKNQHHPDLTVSILHKQQTQRIKNRLVKMQPDDIAYLLEALPKQQRVYVWDNIEADKTGDILLEFSDALRASLLSKQVNKILKSLNPKNRQQLETAMSYEEDSVGALMDFNMNTIREYIRIKGILRYCQKLGDLPEPNNQMFVVVQNYILKGSLALEQIIASNIRQFLFKEIAISLINGLIWAGIMAVFV